ncbi:MAG: tetratricopeptide repeat protein [Bacteroidota bacterium]
MSFSTLLLILSFFPVSTALGQFNQQKADSLEVLISHSTEPLIKAHLLYDVARMYQFADVKKAKSRMIEAVHLVEEQHAKEDIAKYKTYLSALAWLDQDRDSAISISQEVIDLVGEDDRELLDYKATNLTILAQIFEESGQYSMALDYYDQVLALPVEDKSILMSVNNNLGNLYNDLNNYDKSIDHFLKAKSLAKELGNKYGSAIIESNLGLSYRLLGEYEKALAFYQRSISINEGIGNSSGKIDGLKGLGSVYKEMDSLPKAIQYYQEALKIAQTSQISRLQLAPLIDIAHIYIQQNELQLAYETFQQCLAITSEDDLESQSDRAMIFLGFSTIYNRQKKHRQALLAARKAIELESSTQKDISPTLVDSYRELSQAQFQLGQSTQAFESLTQMQMLGDSLAAIQNLKETKTLELKYSVAEKEQEMAILESEKNAEIKTQKASNRFFAILAGIAFFAAVFLYFFLRQQTKQKQRLQIQHQQITEQHQIITKQAEALQELDSLKSRLFANVSHELRTPLTLILGPLSSALKEKGHSNKTSTFLQLAQQNGQKLLQLINEILDLSKMDAGKLELIEKPIMFHPFLRRLLSQFESHAQSKGVELSMFFEPDPFVKIQLDSHKFELIFNNLLSNALKFTPSNGKVNVSLLDLGNQFSLVVEDSGSGIAQEDLTHIFDRFYQATHSGSSAQGGTGIGLALCHEYAKLFQGSMTVESELGKGSTFRFQFPLKQVLGAFNAAETPDITPPVPFAEQESFQPLSGKHLLLVEDNHSLRTYIQTVLANRYQISSAENGKIALELLEEEAFRNSIDLIISDVMMPVMDGFQLLEHVKEDPLLRSIPVVILTARAEMVDKLKALRIGVDDYMTKPFQEEELQARIDNLLRHAEQRKIVQETGFGDEVETDAKASHESKQSPSPIIPQKDIEWLEKLESISKALIPNFGFTIDVLAHEIGTSRRQLHRKIKTLTGLRPNQYLMEVRLQQARRLLENQEVLSVKAASYEVGIKDTKYFSKQFKQRFGKLPSAFVS